MRPSTPWLLSLFSVLSAAALATPAEDPAIRGQAVFDRAACLTMRAGAVAVVADPLHGGRLVEYSLNGTNVLYADPDQPDRLFPAGNPYLGPAGGRFDLGPEESVPDHPELWEGPWAVLEHTPLKIRLQSTNSPALGIQMTREFRLDPTNGLLTCIQILKNTSSEPKTYGHWFRSFAPSGGLCVVPVNPHSRFKNGYLLYSGWPKFMVQLRPEDPAVEQRDGCLIVKGTPALPKVGIDSDAGWYAYLHPAGLLFVKRFLVYPNSLTTDIAGITVAFYYGPGLAELESYGPSSTISPGDSLLYRETWQLLPLAFPTAGKTLDPAQVRQAVQPLLMP